VRTDYIGLRVARWRDIGGRTQQQLADAVGVTREYISMIENGRRPVTSGRCSSPLLRRWVYRSPT
jgi:transcriptional regulator with XRE-family HTH domain